MAKVSITHDNSQSDNRIEYFELKLVCRYTGHGQGCQVEGERNFALSKNEEGCGARSQVSIDMEVAVPNQIDPFEDQYKQSKGFNLQLAEHI